MNCESPGCLNKANTNFIEVEHRVCVGHHLMCSTHGTEMLESHFAKATSIPASRSSAHTEAEKVEIDLEAMFIDYTTEDQSVYMREAHGTRAFAFSTGHFGAHSIMWCVKPPDNQGVPLTHEMMWAVIATLGGKLKEVVIDGYDPNTRIYHSSLCIDVARETRMVTSRLSDAVALAIVCGVSILVRNDVLSLSCTDDR